MKKIILILILVLGMLGDRASLSKAEEDEDDIYVYDVSIGLLKLDDLNDTLLLYPEDTSNEKIKISGKSSSGVRRVLVSLDGGGSWQNAVSANILGAPYWDFNFRPRARQTYNVVIKPYDFRSNAGKVLKFAVFYDTRSQKDIIKDIVGDMESFYNDKDLEEFLSLFDKNLFKNMSAFEENLRETFENFSNLDLTLKVRKIVFTQDTAQVTINWERRWEEQSSLEGWGDTLSFIRNPNWVLFGISRKKIFIWGSGHVSVKLLNS